ncbi:MAG TPA: hypothetical protein VGK29_22270 [Paludibaculum sp.]
MPYARFLAALLSANLLSLVLLNAIRLPVWALLPILPGGIVAAWLVLRPLNVRRLPFRASRWAVLFAAAAFVLLTAPRLPYLAEWLPGAVVLAQADDYGRLSELISMTLGGRYPLPHPSNQQFLLSHYYAALFPMAWCKLAIPVLTLKDCIVLGNMLYHALFLLSLLEVAPRLVRRPAGATVLVFLMTLFGGLDLLAGRLVPFEHTELWQRSWLGAMREFSSMYTANFWTVHHMAAVWCVLLAFVLCRETRSAARWRKPLIAGWLLVAAGACSLFVALTLPLLAWRELGMLLKRLWRSRMILPVAAASLTPLWLYTNRVAPGGFAWRPVPHLLPVYLLAIFLVDFAGLPLLVLARWRQLARSERRWLGGAMLFFVLTWGVESVGYNNFAMRGGLAPSIVIFLLAARHGGLPRAKVAVGALAALATLTTLTTLREAVTMTYAPLEFSNWYWQTRGLPVPAHVRPLLRDAYRSSVRNPSARVYRPDAGNRLGPEKFNAEKLIEGIPFDQMHGAEQELARFR